MRIRILQITDIHASQKFAGMLEKIVETEKPDVVIICGDITHFGPYSFASQILNSIKVRGFTVLGNCDLPDTFEKISIPENIIHLHGDATNFMGQKFAGFGGANGTPWAYGNLYSEAEIYTSLAKIADAESIVITHTPPCSFVRARIGEEMGSAGVDRILIEKKPKAILCGHIHEADGVEKIGSTVIVNPGPAKHGRYAIVEIEENKVEALINED
ncbi:MAG: metallophosphoesterase family protein [Thermoplasmata archaeon]